MRMPPLPADFTHARPCIPFCEKYLTLPLFITLYHLVTEQIHGGHTLENHEKRPLPEARTYTVEDIAAMLNIGRTSAYTLVKEGHFKTVRIGTAIRISKKSFDEWLEELDL